MTEPTSRRRRPLTDVIEAADGIDDGAAPDEADVGPPTITVPRERDELGRPTEVVEVADPIAAEHWDDRLWRHR